MARTGSLPHADDQWLAAIDEPLKRLAARGEIRRYRKNTILIEEGDRGDTLYVILDGRLRAYSVGALGREITFGVYGPGEYIGEMSLDGGPRSACVETVAHSVCSIIDREVLRSFMAECPDFAFDLLSKVIRRARAATLSAKHMALNDVYGRLKLLFESMGEDREDGSRRMTERLTHKDLAQRLGCSREMVSRVMKDLKGGGYVSQVDGRLVLERPLPPRW